ncbi:hypothetical protein JTB14_014640 [Gonioctena quinquepunctata]|nr:hypothetical protein JTB14_014640 [Gonioctena quinquepunctata]
MYNSKSLPTEGKLQLITDVAHQESVQKPAFVAKSFSTQCESVCNIDVHEIYDKLNPTAKNILMNIDISDNELDPKQRNLWILHSFIKECAIRFCSGSDIIHKKIKYYSTL